MAVDTPVVDHDKLMAFMGQVVGELGAAVNAGLVVIGDRLGLYRALADAGPLSPAALAAATGTTERYVLEWLNTQAAGGYVDYDTGSGRYSLSAEHALALADKSSPAFVGGAFQLALATLKSTTAIESAFRSGKGFGWHQHDEGVHVGCERFFRPGYNANLLSSWLPALDESHGKAPRRREGGRHRLWPGCNHPVDGYGLPQFELHRLRLPSGVHSAGP